MKEGVGVPKDGGLIGPGNEQSTQTFPGHGKGGDPDAVEGGTGGKELFQSLWDLQPVPLKHVQIAEQAERSKAGRHIRDGVTLPDDTLPRSAGWRDRQAPPPVLDTGSPAKA